MKKILSLFLVFVLAISAFSVAVAQEATTIDINNLSEVENLKERLKSPQNIVYGFQKAKIGTNSSFSLTYGDVSSPMKEYVIKD